MSTSSDDKDSYLLSRDLKSSVRLNFQHWHMKELLGYNIHPSISTTQAELCIVDIATGTGIWPIEVSRSLPAAYVDGFDISSNQYPNQERLPARVRLLVHDAFKPFPSEYQGEYDIVHIQFFILLVSENEMVIPILKNLLSLLKPGGYLQWMEPDPLSVHVEKPDGVDSAAMQEYVDTFRSKGKVQQCTWVQNFGKIFAEHGLTKVMLEHRKVPKELEIFTHQQVCMLLEEINARDSPQSIRSEAAAKTQHTITEMQCEFAAGAFIQTEYTIAVGRKPNRC